MKDIAVQFAPLTIPTWGTGGRPASPKEGTVGYNQETNKFELWDGLAWILFDDTTALAAYVPYTGATTDVNLGTKNLTTTGTIGGGAITGTSFVIGASALTTSEFGYLDGQNQAVKTTDTPQFAGLGLNVPKTTNEILLLKPTLKFTTVFIRANSGAYTDVTTESSNGVGFGVPPAVGNGGIGTPTVSRASMYYGSTSIFTKIACGISSAGFGFTLAASYWNGTAWTALTITDGTSNYTVGGVISFTAPGDWTSATVNTADGSMASGAANRYYVRIFTTTTAASFTGSHRQAYPDTQKALQFYGTPDETAPAFKLDYSGSPVFGAPLFVSPGMANPYASPYQFSLQTATNATWFEILNSTGGASKGSFFGMFDNKFQQYNYQGGEIEFFTAPTAVNEVLRLTIGNDGSIIINETGVSTADVRIEGDTDINLFFTDASADKVGIGMNNPAYKLDVTGDINIPSGNAYRVNGTAGVSGSFTTVDLKTVTVTKGIITSIV